ncbi:MAG: hypothetical protein FJ253_02215 [Phycisphaerae bacterium]|nr:hypothetical protein [Phycisphaerae bacterium]
MPLPLRNRQDRAPQARFTVTAAAIAVAAAVGAAMTARTSFADNNWSWTAINGDWYDQSNWTPVGIPGLDLFNYTVINIGNLPGVQNGTVLLDAPAFSGAHTFDELNISSGMTLDMNGNELGSLTGITELSEVNSRLIVRPSAGPNFHDLGSNLELGAGTILEMKDDSRLRTWDAVSFGTIVGRGTLHLQGGPSATLVNHGIISGGSNGPLHLLQESTGRIDLDGNGNGQISMMTPYTQLLMTGDQLQDPFSGTAFLGTGVLLTMDFDNGWSADANSTFNVTSAVNGAAVQIDGSEFTFGGDLNIGGTHGRLRMLAHSVFTSTADVSLGDDDVLEFDDDATIEGGLFTLDDGARIDFDDFVKMEGGSFVMAGDTLADGVVNFDDYAEWDGEVSFDGVARMNGSAMVSGSTVIHATVFDFDGVADSNDWIIQAPLVINADSLDEQLGNWNGSWIMVNGPGTAGLLVNLSDPSAAWRSTGWLQLGGIGVLPVTRLAGSPVEAHGFFFVGGGLVQVTADLAMIGATVQIEGDSTLRTRGITRIDAASTFQSSGMLWNGIGGELTLETGADFANTGLLNQSILKVGDETAGIATVDRFENKSAGFFELDIGGTIAGAEYDRLVVTGDVTLDGTLTVQLRNGFVPASDQVFKFLTWTGSRSGEFDFVSTCDGAEIHYGANAAWITFTGKGGMLGDLDGNGVVDGSDLGLLLGQWGDCDDPCCIADLNDDGVIDGDDLGILLGQWSN